jgi:gamma-glutamylcyclotransferase (GGCT)/AIG2-like uncharacterized protein YtfP
VAKKKKTVVFVYGTLKRGFRANRLIADSEFLGPAKTAPNFRLFNVGSFPGLVRAEDGVSVEGELYEVSPETLEYLDQYEGVDSGFYSREEISIVEPKPRKANSYIFQQDTAKLEDCGVRWE